MLFGALQSQDENQIRSFQRKAEVNHEIQQLKSKMRESQVLYWRLPHICRFDMTLKICGDAFIRFDLNICEFVLQKNGPNPKTPSDLVHHFQCVLTHC